jgi:hypothetical protein
LIGIIVGIAIMSIIRLAEKESLDGLSDSCTGDCSQGRNCNCKEIKK